MVADQGKETAMGTKTRGVLAASNLGIIAGKAGEVLLELLVA